MNKRRYIFILLLLLGCFARLAAGPVTATVSQKRVSKGEVDVVFKLRIQSPWHVYSTALPAGGPTSASLNVERAQGLRCVGGLKAEGRELRNYDPVFSMTLRYFEGSVTFTQRFEITAAKYAVSGYLQYGACNDENCLPPTAVNFAFSGEGLPAADVKAKAAAAAKALKTSDLKGNKNNAENPLAISQSAMSGGSSGQNANLDPENGASQSVAADMPNGGVETVDDDAADVQGSLLENADTASWGTASPLWKPVTRQMKALGAEGEEADTSLLYVLLMGLLGGFLALFTPCVWPIIPMTVSFFLKRAKDKRRGVRDAITYGVAIVVIYLSLGLLITLMFGASSLNSLATNAVVNIFFCLLLIVFALSFFGWFEIALPTSWSNRIDQKAGQTTGWLSIFLMAFTLALVSFSCTGPIIGFLLVEVSATGNVIAPAMGMLGFAVALALPFTLFALFPSCLKSAPRSGSWMNTIKVVLGFVELAFALKFFSVADLAYGWGLLTREVFLALWIVIFAFLGAYLAGFLRFQSDMDNARKPQPVLCVMLAMVSFAFALYMVPGLWGAPCKAISAFSPPMSTQDFNLYKGGVRARFNDYEAGMRFARAKGKPVLVDFTGYGCVNCRKMEAAVWEDDRVRSLLDNDFVLISLYVDDKTPLPKPVNVTLPGGKTMRLRTVGDKWSFLQQVKFGALVQPFYVALDAGGNALSPSRSYDEDVKAYISFLKKALQRHGELPSLSPMP